MFFIDFTVLPSVTDTAMQKEKKDFTVSQRRPTSVAWLWSAPAEEPSGAPAQETPRNLFAKVQT